MFTPITARAERRRSCASRRAAASAPWLLKPIRLITARSGTSRNSRGRGFPSCAIAVIVPTSMCPNPSAYSPLAARTSLSKPAATPNGDSKLRPSASVFSGAGARVSARAAHENGGMPSSRITTIAA